MTSEQWVPAPKDSLQFVIQNLGPSLKKQVRPAQRPVHLLFLDEASAHHLINRRLDEHRADRFPLPIVPTENSILLKKRKRLARGNEIGWALRLLYSHGWIHELSAGQEEVQVDRGA